MKIIFDVDGVLINGYNATPERRIMWDANIEKDLGIKQSDLTTHFFNKRFGDVIIGKRPLLEAMNESLSDLNYSGTAQSIIDYWMDNDSRVNNQVLDVVQKLKSKSIPLYIATNQEHVRANYLWNNLNFKDYFQDIFYSAKIGHTKSSSLYFDYVNNKLGRNEDILFFDDYPENVEAAKNAGWNAFVFNDIHDLTNNPFIQEILQ